MGRKNKKTGSRKRTRALKIKVHPTSTIAQGASLVFESALVVRMDARKRLETGQSTKRQVFREFQELLAESDSAFSQKEKRMIMARARGVGQALKEKLNSS